MQELLDKLDRLYPDWRRYHCTPIEAGVEIGIVADIELDCELIGGELDFADDSVITFDTDETDYD